jgi:hypothetical protein
MRQASTGRTTQIREPITPSVGDAEAVAGRRVGPPLFGTLLASRPNAERRSTAVATAVAVALHATIVFTLIQVTAVAGADATDDEEVVTVMVPIDEPLEPPPPPPPPRIETPVVRAEDVQGFQTLSVPNVIIEDRTDKILFVKADPAVKYQNVIGAMDAARGAGVTVLGAILPRSKPIS